MATDHNFKVKKGLHVLGTEGIYLTDTNTRIAEGSGNSVRIITSTGHIDIGSMNSGWVHMQANKNIYILPSSYVSIDGNLQPYTDSARTLGSNGTRWSHTYTDNVTVTDNIALGGTISGGTTITSSGNITTSGGSFIGTSGHVQTAGAYFSGDIRVLNNAGDGWNVFADRTNGKYVLSAITTVNVDSGYLVGGTAVINSSRGLTNITSGNIAGNLTIDYTGNGTNDAGIAVFNDSSDWGIKIDKDGTATYGLMISADGNYPFYVTNAAGTEIFRIISGGATTQLGSSTVGNSSTAARYRAHYSDGAYMDLEGYGLVMNRGASYVRPSSDGDKTLYIGGADASLDWNSIHFRSVNGLYMTGTQFLDTNRNLVNIGTINTGQGATEVHLMNQNVRSSDSPTFQNLTVQGNLSITGDINSYNVTDLDVVDKTITLGVGGTASANDGGGIIVDGANAKLTWGNSAARWTMNKSLQFSDTATTTNQAMGIFWPGFDKEGTSDYTDNAKIIHTTNTGGHAGSVLLIESQNDANDGIAFITPSASKLKHNSNNIFTDAYHPNADKLTTARTIAGTSFDGTANIDISYDNLTNKPSNISNADTVDSLHASSFVRRDGVDAGAVTIKVNDADFIVQDTSDSITNYIWRHHTNQYLYLGTANAQPRTRYDLYTDSGSNKYWHAGNDGPGSGLDADTVDGVQLSNLARTDVHETFTSHLTVNNNLYLGDNNDGYFYNDQNGRTAFTGGDFYFQSGITNFYNYATNQYYGDSSGDNIYFRGNNLSGDDWAIIGSNGATAIGHSSGNMDITNLRLQVNGHTSIYGGNYLYFGITSNNQNSWKNRITGFNTSTLHINAQGLQVDNTGYASPASVWLKANNTEFSHKGNTIWHAGNDGSGSGLDADLLDGWHRSEFTHAEASQTWTSIAAATTQAKRYHIARLYGCPAHWDSDWQNIELHVTAESYEAGTLKYKIHGNYGGAGTQANMIQMQLTEAYGDMIPRFRIILGSPVDAGWDHSGQDTYYVDVFAEASHYSNWKIHAKTFGHGVLSSNPTSGGAKTVFYSSPTVTNISTFSETHTQSTIRLDTSNIQTQTAQTKLKAHTNGWAGGLALISQDGSDTFQIHPDNNGYMYVDKNWYFTNNVYIGSLSNTVWHLGNDGSGSGLDADTVDGKHKDFLMHYKGIVSGNWDTIFSQTDGHMGVYEVQNISSGHSNYPSGSYTYGGVLSWQLDNSTFKLYAPHTGTLWYQTGWNNDEYSGWRKIWDNGNDGSGSGLDADVLDGIQASSFLRSDAGDTATGSIVFNGATQYFRRSDTTNYTNTPLIVESYGGSSSTTGIGFHISGQLGRYLRMNSAGVLAWEGSTIWHAGNDGSGSGLDADNLDGYSWTSQNKAVAARNLTIEAGDGQGIGFWGGTGTVLGGSYAIAMSSVGNSNAGRMSYDTSSDYNMYFKMSAGTDRGFVFKNSNSAIMGVDGAGHLRAKSSISSDGRQVMNCCHWSNSGTSTGAIKIALPGTTSNYSMPVIEVHTYDYSSKAHVIYRISGHNWQTASNWYNNRVTAEGGPPLTVRLGHDGTTHCIFIGDTNTSWSYGHATVSLKAHPSFYNSGQNFTEGWSISQVTSIPSTTTVQTVGKLWHSANDGSGSGLDADTLDGYNTSTSATANTVTVRTSSGHIYGNYILGSYLNASSGNSENPTIGQIWTQSTSDNYLRKSTPAHLISQLSLTTTSALNANDRFYISDTRGANRDPSYYDDRYVQADFSQNVYFGLSSGVDAWGTALTVSKWSSYDASHRQEQLIFAGTKLARRVATSDSAWSSTYTIWDSSTDGSGSGLDADTLDGLNSSSLLRSDADDAYDGTLTVNGMQFRSSNANRNLKLQGTSGGTDCGISGHTSDGSHGYQLYGTNSGYYGFLDGNWGSWDIQKVKNGTFKVDEGSGLKRVLNEANWSSYISNVSGYAGTLNREDNRTISPSELTSGRLKFGFTSWANNNTSPYADFLHLRSYTDSSGGNDNLLMFNKSSKNMRLYQQSYGSSTAYSSYVDFWHTGNDGSGSGLDADLLDGYHAGENGGNKVLKLASNGYSQIQNWTNVATAGIYSATTNGAHFYPNTGLTTYGTWRVNGTRNGYTGIVYDGGGDVVSSMYDSGGNGGDWNGTNGWQWYWHRSNSCLAVAGSTTSSSYSLYVGGAIYATNDVVAYSDRRIKENIVTIDTALEKVNKLRGVYYNRIDDEDKEREIGFIAQEVNEVAPELVTYAEDVDQYGVKYGNTTALLVEAIKELTQQVKDLKQEVEELKNG